MKITSIDNCYEDDGLVNLQATLMALARQNLNDPTRQIIVAILPEYGIEGNPTALSRLNVCTVDACDPGGLEAGQVELMEATGVIVENLQRHRAAAMKALDDAPLPSVIKVDP